MPFAAARRCAPTNAIGEFPTEFLRPVANAFVADVNAMGGEHFLDHAQAERKSEIEPNRVRNHLGGKAMPAIERITSLFHAPPLPANRPCLVKLAVPARASMDAPIAPVRQRAAAAPSEPVFGVFEPPQLIPRAKELGDRNFLCRTTIFLMQICAPQVEIDVR